MFALGALLMRVGFLSSTFCREATRLNYWFGVPVLLFYAFSGAFPSDSRGSFFLSLFVLAAGLAAVCTCLTAILFRFFPALPAILSVRRYQDAFVFLVLPMVLAFPDRDWGLRISAHEAAIILILLLHHALDFGRQTTDSATTRRFFRSLCLHAVASAPLWIILGVGLYVATGVGVPDPIDSTFRMIITMVIPFGALSLGGVYAKRPWSRFQR